MHARRRIVNTLCVAIVAIAASAAAFVPGAATPAAGASDGHGVATVVTLAGKRYVVNPGPRLGVKPIHPVAARPAANTTVTIHSSATSGVVSNKPIVYLVFWGSQWSSDPAGAAPALQNFFNGLYGAADTWGLIATQYCEGVPAGSSTCGAGSIRIEHATSSILAGVWFDNSVKAPKKAKGSQIAAEAVAAATHFGNTTSAANLNAQYVIASPTHAKPDGFPSKLCGYHSYTSSVDGNVVYTNLPYVADLGAGGCTTISHPTALDGYFSTETHEFAETITDFYIPAGWFHSNTGGEIGDLCEKLDARETLSTGTFDVQGLWSNQARGCRTSG
jgi:hypothetical protein